MPVTAHEIFEGYSPCSVCITSPDYFAFVLKQSEPDDPEQEDFYEDEGYRVRFTACKINDEGNQIWGAKDFEPCWKSPKAVHTNYKEFLVYDKNCFIYNMGLGKNKGYEEDIHKFLSPDDMVNIEEIVFGVSVARMLYIRKGPSNWEEIQDTKHWPGYDTSDTGFETIDGFDLSNIYVAGGDKDIFHFNYHTREWKQIDLGFTGNFTCNTVCCAEDGNVYIGARHGLIARGRDDKWEVQPTNIKDDIQKIVSYQGKILVSTHSMTYQLNDDFTLTPYDFEGELDFLGGPLMDTAYGMLIIANGYGQIALHDGKHWHNLYGCDELSQYEKDVYERKQDRELQSMLDQLKTVIKPDEDA